GSTDGIGKLAAIRLAKEGHELYLHGRNFQKLASVIQEIKEISSHPNINGFTADFSDLDAVKEMAKQMHKQLPKLDVLINNAGVFKSKTRVNQQGLDLRMVVNYLAPYILTRELLPLLEKGTSPRVINLSSAAQAPVSKAVLLGQQKASENEAYAQSKLALTMWSFYLAQKRSDLSVIAVNPGSLLNTNMVKEAYGRFWSSADKGAKILHELATSPNYEGITGKYYDNDSGQLGNAHVHAYHAEKIEQLIQLTEKILGADAMSD
ncbi:MAG: SDR family NAD(P)-dependent oxidoreductase, partial [Bacteroidota bacterium]